MAQRKGKTIFLKSKPRIIANAGVAGKKEGEGPLKQSFDLIQSDTHFGEPSWEKAESRMQALALEAAMQKAAVTTDALDYVFARDLLNRGFGKTLPAGEEAPAIRVVLAEEVKPLAE